MRSDEHARPRQDVHHQHGCLHVRASKTAAVARTKKRTRVPEAKSATTSKSTASTHLRPVFATARVPGQAYSLPALDVGAARRNSIARWRTVVTRSRLSDPFAAPFCRLTPSIILILASVESFAMNHTSLSR